MIRSVLLVLLLSQSALADVFVLRHAETTAGENPDPPLSAEGERRAAGLVDLLDGLRPTAVFSSDFARTRATAAPLATAADVEVTIYDARAPESLIEELRSGEGHQVVVGHSNTVPALVHMLGGAPGPDIDHSEYDRVYRLRRTDAGIETTVLRSQPVHRRLTPRPFRVSAQRIRDETFVFAMSLNGKPAGTSSWRYLNTATGLHLEELTTLPDYDTDATISVATAPDLGTGTISMSGKMFGKDTRIEAEWGGARVSGESEIARASYRPQGKIALAADWPVGGIERSTALMLAHALPPPDDAMAFRWFSIYDGEFRDIEVEQVGTETVTVPAGTFDTYKLSYSGGAPSQIFYITREKPHRAVRIDIVAMPWRYELLRIVPD